MTRSPWRQIAVDVDEDLLAVQVWSPQQAMAVGKAGLCLRLDGGTWRREATGLGEDLYSVWGPAPEEVFAVGGDLHVGGQSKVCHYRDGAWTVHPSGIQSLLLSVFGGGPDVVRAVGFNGGIVQRTADGWREIDAGTNEHLFCIRTLGPARWLVLGLNGTLREYDGTAWRPIDETEAHLTCAWVRREDVAAVGYGGTVLRRRADTWQPESSATDEHLFGVWGDESDRLFACGADGTLLRHDGTAWTVEQSPSRAALYGISGAGGTVVAVGTSGTILRRAR